MITYVLRYYTQYTLKDVFGKRFKDGGLTRKQVKILFAHASESEYNRLRLQAIFNGMAVWGKDPNSIRQGQTVKGTPQQSLPDQSPKFPVFRNPSEYEDLTTEEKNRLTEDMMKAHKSWASEMSSDLGR